jgi:hypothetical protein
VRNGLFDAVLVRPLGALMQLVAWTSRRGRVGRVVIGVALLGVAAAHADSVRRRPRLALLVVARVAGALIFRPSSCDRHRDVLVVESGELGNALTYGGHDFSGYRSRCTGRSSRASSPTGSASRSSRTTRRWRCSAGTIRWARPPRSATARR